MSEIAELIARWDANEGKPYKGSLIDWDSYGGEGEPPLSCMCAQGQVLHVVGGRGPDWFRNIRQSEADRETAKLLNISRAHSILLRNINDKADGAPSIVLTDPGKVLGDQWSKLLDFWWAFDQFGADDWRKVAAAWDAAVAAAWDAARAAAGAAARDAALHGQCLVVKDKIDPKHLSHAKARWDVWERGYALLCDVNWTLYVYAKEAA